LSINAAATSAFAGPIEIVSDAVMPDPIGRQTTFQITFNQPPDLFGFDAFGRPNNAFQYFYDSEPEPEPDGIFSGDTVVVIRGPEIRFAHSIPIRDSLNPEGVDFPNAEGWGLMRDDVDFTLDGPTVRFTVPWKALGETDGKFSYHLIALDRGDLTSSVAATSIPLPPAAVTAPLAAAAAAATRAAWRHLARRARLAP
jgi:hypothetical protein